MTDALQGAFGDLALQRLADAEVIGMIAGVDDQVVAANDYFLRLIGYDRSDLSDGKIDWRELTPPEWAPADRRAYEEAVGEGLTRTYEKEYVRRDGTRVSVLVGGAVVDPGPPMHYVSFVVDLSAQKAAEAAREVALVAERIERSRVEVLQRLTAALAVARDSQEVATTVVEMVTAGLGAQTGSVRLFDTDWAPNGDADPIVAEVRSTRRPVLIASPAERALRYPTTAVDTAGQLAWAYLPLVVDRTVVGTAVFGWGAPVDFLPEDLAMLEAVAGQCAAALDRARWLERERAARAAAEAAQARLALLARASAVLAGAQDEETLLTQLADLLQPLCTWSTVSLLDEQNALVRRQVRNPDPENAELVARLQGEVLELMHPDDPRTVALATGRTATTTRSDLLPMAVAKESPILEQVRRLPLTQLLAVPIAARSHVLGVLSMWREDGQPAFTPADIELAGDVGNRAGTALDTLRTLAARTRVAAALQASLLPTALPEIPGIELSARYLAAEAAAEVGGDFYDAFALGSGEYALTIGDVAGRGVQAAGLTGLARSTLRAVPSELGPGLALARLNTILLGRTGPEDFLTAAYLRLRPDAGGVDVTVASAGHPLPLVVRGHGTVEPIGETGPLLGLLDTVEIPERRTRLSRGDSLLLYTDGVIEAQGADGLFGEERLAALLADGEGRSAKDLAAAVQGAVVDYRTHGPDDVAVLALRVTP